MVTRSAQEIWSTALGELQVQVSKPNFRTWLEKTVGASFQDNRFVISVPSTFVAEYLDKNQRSLIEKTLIGLTASTDINVVFQVNGLCGNSPGAGKGKGPDATGAISPRFNPNYVFASFIVGKCNRLAYAAAEGIIQNPGHGYNPLFIYGGTGLGKTHLLHAIGQAALAKNTKVICVSAEQFTNEFVNAVRTKKTDEFRAKYRSAGMLLIDDIHFISGKEQTEECFFHTFNELHNVNRQIVITSDQPPKLIPMIEERLCSRFEWGLIVDIQPPEFETRLAILQTKMVQIKTDIGSDTLEYIARQPRRNIRELEGALNRVVAYARLFDASPNIELAAKALENIASKEPGNASVTVTPGLVIEEVANCFQIDPADIISRKRDKEISMARRVAMYILRQETSYSVAQIGQELGDRNPSAVTNACKSIAKTLSSNPYLSRKVAEITQKLSNTQVPADIKPIRSRKSLAAVGNAA